MKSIFNKSKVLNKIMCVFMVLLTTISIAKAQVSTKTVLKNWTVLAESGNSIDVSYTIVKCENVPNQILFSLFNESSKDQNVKFAVTIKDDISHATFTKNIALDTKKMNIYKADCESANLLSALIIDLPTNYNPNHLTLSISFN